MINVSETAAAKISELLAEEHKTGSGLRVFVQGGGCSGFQYGLMIEESGESATDQVFESRGVKLFVDPISVRYLEGAEVDFIVYGQDVFCAIEVKNSYVLHPGDLRGLKSFKLDYPECKTLLLYRGKERLLKGDILCVPCEEFLRSLKPNSFIV